MWANTQPGPPANGNHRPDPWVGRIRSFIQVAEGAYSLGILTRHALYAVRNPLGLRPLCLSEFPDGGYVFAYESCALQTIGAKFLREVRPGEIVRLDQEGLRSISGIESKRQALCIFEYVYFARPDSQFEDQVVRRVRQQLGRQLAKETPPCGR